MQNDVTTPHISIHTGGSCHNNPGPAGYAAILRRMDNGTAMKRKVVEGFDPSQTTGPRVELTAVLKALEALKPEESQSIYVFASSNISRGMNEYLPAWLAKGWRNSDGKRVRNHDLWRAIVSVSVGRTITWLQSEAEDPVHKEVSRLARKQKDRARRRAAEIMFAA